MNLRWICVLTATCLTLYAQASPLALPDPPDMAFAPTLGKQVPLDLVFRDDDGTPVRLRELSAHRPVILVPGYYHCPNLCSTVMDGVLESLAQAHLPRGAWRVVAFSIDSGETVAVAAAKKQSYGALVAASGGNLHMLTGDTAAVGTLMQAIGMRVSRPPGASEIAHAAGFAVLTPDGRIAQAFNGVRFDASALRTAIERASAGKVGSPAQQLLMRCVHFDPLTGRYTVTILDGIRALFLGAFAALAGWWLWQHRQRRRSS
ncbi:MULTISPECIES: SCO family protein [Cupriavidus]|uniref:SCO1/SenC family protein n=1 Tax=Cupriavidus pinatubonensis (strain JMP 134 / LMG 1197) TaxID=264198 RepID=Q46SU9_CUPPJ|nr:MULTISPECIES: SCO family protein [Cupriavidus]QYY28518.1 SCO family protein [Cupriavidus pinatubonensis]